MRPTMPRGAGLYVVKPRPPWLLGYVATRESGEPRCVAASTDLKALEAAAWLLSGNAALPR